MDDLLERHRIKSIRTQGISYIETLDATSGWYWGTDYTHGDLYEADELYRTNHPVKCNRLVFIHYPDGRIVEPIRGIDGQYFGRPIFFEGRLLILLVDFPKSLIQIFQYDDCSKQTMRMDAIPLTEVIDCYNLHLSQTPLMLSRQGNDGAFQEIWPQKTEFEIGESESFICRDGDKLFFSRWFEDPDYREKVVVRQYPTGEIIEVLAGNLMEMPDGQRWLLL